MSRLRSAAWLATRIASFGVVAWAATCASAAAQETVTITIPAAVFFNVADVSVSTSGAPSPMRVSFSNATLGSKSLRVSVQADAGAFTPPNGPGIPVSKVSWAIVGQNNGVGINGTLSSTSYAFVFQSNPATPEGYVDLGWTLAAPGSGIRAGNHQLTIRWKLESIAP